MRKTYLGDSVYAEFDGYHIILTTENGKATDPSNRICLDRETFSALLDYKDCLAAEAKQIREHEETALGGLEGQGEKV